MWVKRGEVSAFFSAEEINYTAFLRELMHIFLYTKAF